MQRGGWLWPRSARKGATPARGQTAGATVRGWPAAARRPQGATNCGFGARRKAVCGHRHRLQGLSPARATASSGNACRGSARGGVGHRGVRPLAEWLPAGKSSRRLHRGSSGGGGAVRVNEG
ncbi:hypothetical protein BHE74_00005726 [Ensete ventricosum]|nr:hypothetical protein GW17_00038734 [Ensete ventricosum]RWW85585.1 hypothetical protein BHE74_00005726 [Ensete ventricosum]